MTRMISLDYHFRYHSAYYIVYHRFLPKTYTKLFSINGCYFWCCCFQCDFPYLIVGIRAWFAGSVQFSGTSVDFIYLFLILIIFIRLLDMLWFFVVLIFWTPPPVRIEPAILRVQIQILASTLPVHVCTYWLKRVNKQL
jgi:hypothetical protein